MDDFGDHPDRVVRAVAKKRIKVKFAVALFVIALFVGGLSQGDMIAFGGVVVCALLFSHSRRIAVIGLVLTTFAAAAYAMLGNGDSANRMSSAVFMLWLLFAAMLVVDAMFHLRDRLL